MDTVPALPGAFQDVITIIQLMERESFINGVCNHVLSQYFPLPRYTIAPEYRVEKNDIKYRVDLVVFCVKTNDPVFIYEGKKAGYSDYKTSGQKAGYLKFLQKELNKEEFSDNV